MTGGTRLTEYRIRVNPPSGDPSAVVLYLNRPMLKLAIAEWHRHEFDNLDDDHTGEHFSRFSRRSLDVLGHGDGLFLQLSDAFDAFACPVAHRQGLGDPDGASFRARLAHACERALAERIQTVSADPEFEALTAYRKLAAHRGVVGESISMGERANNPGLTIRLVLPVRFLRVYPISRGLPFAVLERYANVGTSGPPRIALRGDPNGTLPMTRTSSTTIGTSGRRPTMGPDELERRIRERLDALGPPRAEPAPCPHAARLRASRPDRRVLGPPAESRLRRSPDRLRGPDAAGGARRNGAGGRARASRHRRFPPKKPIMGQVVETGTEVCPYCSERVRARE
jgi:hypothetical protein